MHRIRRKEPLTFGANARGQQRYGFVRGQAMTQIERNPLAGAVQCIGELVRHRLVAARYTGCFRPEDGCSEAIILADKYETEVGRSAQQKVLGKEILLAGLAVKEIVQAHEI